MSFLITNILPYKYTEISPVHSKSFSMKSASVYLLCLSFYATFSFLPFCWFLCWLSNSGNQCRKDRLNSVHPLVFCLICSQKICSSVEKKNMKGLFITSHHVKEEERRDATLMSFAAAPLCRCFQAEPRASGIRLHPKSKQNRTLVWESRSGC